MADPHVAIQGLPLLKWRGLEAPPYTMATFRIAHIQARREYARIDGVGHDNTGRDAIPMTFQLWFINGLDNRNDLFPELWEQWFAALDDGSPDELLHPLLGPIDARVENFGADVDSSKTGGVICQVNFTDTVIDPTAFRIINLPLFTLSEIGAAYAGEVADANLNFPDGSSPLDLLNVLGQIEGFAFSITNSIDGLVNKANGIVSRSIDLIEQAQEHSLYAAIDLLQQIWSLLSDIAERSGSLINQAVGSATTDVATTFSQIARERSNTVEELMQLNVELMSAPLIPAGTPFRFLS